MSAFEDTEKMTELLEENNSLLKELTQTLSALVAQRPSFIPLATLVTEIGKSNQTLRYHLESNYEPEVQYKKENGKIVVDSRIVPLIKEHYEK